jgi:hypothetical protein
MYVVTVIRSKMYADNMGYKRKYTQEFDTLEDAKEYKRIVKDRHRDFKVTIKKK